jgi:hypothetical protein
MGRGAIGVPPWAGRRCERWSRPPDRPAAGSRRTGKMLDCEIATVFTIRAGKIARMVALADMGLIIDAYRTERP